MAQLRKKFDEQNGGGDTDDALSPSRVRAQMAAAVIQQEQNSNTAPALSVPSLGDDTAPAASDRDLNTSKENSTETLQPQKLETKSTESTIENATATAVDNTNTNVGASPPTTDSVPIDFANEEEPSVSKDDSPTADCDRPNEERDEHATTPSKDDPVQEDAKTERQAVQEEGIAADQQTAQPTESTMENETTTTAVDSNSNNNTDGVVSIDTANKDESSVPTMDTPTADPPSEKEEPAAASSSKDDTVKTEQQEESIEADQQAISKQADNVTTVDVEEEEDREMSDDAETTDAVEAKPAVTLEAQEDERMAAAEVMDEDDAESEESEEQNVLGRMMPGLGAAKEIKSVEEIDDMMMTDHTFETVMTEQTVTTETVVDGMDTMMTTEHTVETFHDSFETVEETVVDTGDSAKAEIKEESDLARSEHPSDESEPSDSTNSNGTMEDDSENSAKGEVTDGVAVVPASVSDDEDDDDDDDEAEGGAPDGAQPGPKKKKKRKKKRQKRKRKKKKKKKKGKSAASVADSVEHQNAGAASEEELENDTLMELYTLLNVDPHTVHDTTLQEERILSLLASNPEYCSEKFKLEAFSESVYPLSILCAIGASVSAVTTCRDTFPDAIQACDSYVGTPLHYACSYQASLEIVQFLVEANPDMLTKTNRFGRSALHMACMFAAEPTVVGFLLDQLPSLATQVDTESMTPLHICCDSNANNTTLLQTLFDSASGTDACLCPNAQGQLPLHMAVQASASKDSIERLVQACPASTKVADHQGKTATALASSLKLDDSIVLLLSTAKWA